MKKQDVLASAVSTAKPPATVVLLLYSKMLIPNASFHDICKMSFIDARLR
jgi:hypothetical protein